MPFYRTLRPEEQTLLQQHMRILLAEKSWEGCRGCELTEPMKVTIAAQACLLILHLPHEAYRRITSILVYPGSFRTEKTASNDGVGASGLASSHGPVVLAWDSAYRGGRDPNDGHNVVFHEFAHMLDGLDGSMDGIPPVPDSKVHATWRRVVDAEYKQLCNSLGRRRVTFLDEYAATNLVEFFAVATECFFERSVAMRKKHGKLHELFVAFYRQDPTSRRPPTR